MSKPFSLFVAALGASLLVASPAFAQPKSKDAPATTDDTVVGEDDVLYKCGKIKGQITPSFKPETELKDLITWVMGFTCKNFVYDSSILSRSKKITIISPNKMSPQEGYRLFLNAMSTMGMTVVPKGNTLRIVESSAAKGETVSIMRRGTPANSEEIIRFLFRPSYMTPDMMNAAVAVVKSKDGVVSVVGDTLIVTDYSSAVRDMITLVRELDKPTSQDGIYTIRVEHADAKDLQAKLSEILGVGATATAPAAASRRGGSKTAEPEISGGGGAGVSSAVPSKILVDERTNSLIVVASESGYLRVRGLAKRLDIAMDTESGGSIHVYPLENANADELAQTLNTAFGASAPAATTTAGRRGAPVPQRSAAVADGLGSTLEGTVRVTADAPTNALVVVASGRDYLAVLNVIRRLDIARRQVFVEAVILEVKLSDSLSVGSSSHGGVPVDLFGQGLVLGGVQMPELSSLSPTSILGATGLVGGLIGAPLAGIDTLLGSSATSVTIPSYGVLFQALATNSNVNVLSSPTITALDNEEASISVGESFPYKSTSIGLASSAGLNGLSGALGNNIQREQLSLDVKVTPHISANDMVRMEVDISIKAAGGSNADGPIWTVRTAKTKLVVRDQQSVVIGGLVSDQVDVVETKVPLLGDIPILGYLFKYRTKKKAKTNLLMLLTPYVVKDQLDLQTILDRKSRERDEFVRAFNGVETQEYLPRMDYARKRGLVEEINRTVQAVEVEAEVLRALEAHIAIPQGAIEYGDDTDESDKPAPDAATPTPAPTPAATPGAVAPASSPGAN